MTDGYVLGERKLINQLGTTHPVENVDKAIPAAALMSLNATASEAPRQRATPTTVASLDAGGGGGRTLTGAAQYARARASGAPAPTTDSAATIDERTALLAQAVSAAVLGESAVAAAVAGQDVDLAAGGLAESGAADAEGGGGGGGGDEFQEMELSMEMLKARGLVPDDGATVSLSQAANHVSGQFTFTEYIPMALLQERNGVINIPAANMRGTFNLDAKAYTPNNERAAVVVESSVQNLRASFVNALGETMQHAPDLAMRCSLFPPGAATLRVTASSSEGPASFAHLSMPTDGVARDYLVSTDPTVLFDSAVQSYGGLDVPRVEGEVESPDRTRSKFSRAHDTAEAPWTIAFPSTTAAIIIESNGRIPGMSGKLTTRNLIQESDGAVPHVLKAPKAAVDFAKDRMRHISQAAGRDLVDPSSVTITLTRTDGKGFTEKDGLADFITGGPDGRRKGDFKTSMLHISGTIAATLVWPGRMNKAAENGAASGAAPGAAGGAYDALF